MQNYKQILSELGIEVPEDKKADLNRKMNENYRTKADYDKVVKRRNEYKGSLEEALKKLDSLKERDAADLVCHKEYPCAQVTATVKLDRTQVCMRMITSDLGGCVGELPDGAEA